MAIRENKIRSLIRQVLLENTPYPIDTEEEAREFITWMMLNYERASKESNITYDTKLDDDKLKDAWEIYGSKFLRKMGRWTGRKKRRTAFLGGSEEEAEYTAQSEDPRYLTPAVIFTTKYDAGTNFLVDPVGNAFKKIVGKEKGESAANATMNALRKMIPEGHGGVIFFTPPDENNYSWPYSMEFGRYNAAWSKKGSCQDLSNNLATNMFLDIWDIGRRTFDEITDDPFFPIASKSEGNIFRKWAVKNYPVTAETHDLTQRGSHKNETIKKVWNELYSEFMSYIKEENPVLHREFKRRKAREYRGHRDRTSNKAGDNSIFHTLGAATVGNVRIKDFKNDKVKLVLNKDHYTFENDSEAMKVVRGIFKKIDKRNPYKETTDAPPFVIVDKCDFRKGMQYAQKGDKCLPYLLTPGTISKIIARIWTTSPEAMENCGSWALNVVAKSKGIGAVGILGRPLILASPEQMGNAALNLFRRHARNPTQ